MITKAGLNSETCIDNIHIISTDHENINFNHVSCITFKNKCSMHHKLDTCNKEKMEGPREIINQTLKSYL